MIIKRFSLTAIAIGIFYSGIFTVLAQNDSKQNSDTEFTFEFPSIPSQLTSPEERAEYLLTHFWDNFDFNADYSESSMFVEQSLVDFLSVLPYSPAEETEIEAFSILLSKSAANLTLQKDISRLTDIYLANSDSPMRNDKLFISYLKASLSQPDLTEAEKMRKRDMIEMLSKNMAGDIATDFSYKTPNGNEYTLLTSLPSESDLILMFFDPNCESCEEAMAEMINSENLKKRIESGEINILAIYSGDNVSAWQKKVTMLPETWTIGINESEIEDMDLYYFPALPAFYLIGSDGIIKAKEVPLSWILKEN